MHRLIVLVVIMSRMTRYNARAAIWCACEFDHRFIDRESIIASYKGSRLDGTASPFDSARGVK